MKEKCKGCGFPKYKNSIGIIWISPDGYCSVCNHLLKERQRDIVGMDRFVKTKKIYEPKQYLHLGHRGNKLTNRSALREEIEKKHKAMVIPSEYRKALNKNVKKIDHFL